MDNFLVSARKYRPATFQSVVGQDAVTATLKNAIKNNQVAHAYLFCGPRGVGKTTCARILAKTLNCSHITSDTEACQECESCKAFSEQRSYNIHELDAASNNSVDDIRSLIDQVRIPPQMGKYSIYIIDEVHMLSSAAFNAFLKTLEEPPAHALFILATTEKHKILPTILSRCQVFDFQRIRIEDTVRYLEQISVQEGIHYERDGLTIIAQKAEGGMRDALSVFDQIVSFSGGEVIYDQVIRSLNVLDYDYYFRLTEAMLKGDFGNSLLIFDEILKSGFDGHHFISGLASHLRDLLVCRDEITLPLLDVGDNIRDRYKVQVKSCPLEFLLNALEICSVCDVGYKSSKNQRLHVELALLKISSLQNEKKNDLSVREIQPKPSHSEKKEPVPSSGTEVSGSAESVKAEPVKAPDLTPQKTISKGPSIKKALLKKTEHSALTSDGVSASPEPLKKSDLPETPVSKSSLSQEDLSRAWADIAKTFLSPEPRVYNIMNKHDPVPESGSKIRFSVSGTLQLEKMKEFGEEIQSRLKKELNLPELFLDLYVDEEISEEDARPYSSEDKLAYLSELNPEIISLRQVFGLDFD
ncbi:MAG: DNA polymerase III subunit gamma/tau [Bacteroidales bacterium]|nr:DNA polymerase III subunit gamma/tau [Bacteroidales bacterium]